MIRALDECTIEWIYLGAFHRTAIFGHKTTHELSVIALLSHQLRTLSTYGPSSLPAMLDRGVVTCPCVVAAEAFESHFSL